MGTAQMFVDRERDRTGVTPLLTLTAHPCGLVPSDHTWCDVFSPFVGADPRRLGEGFVGGLNLMVNSNFGILVGASFYESEKPKGGLRAGDVIPAGQSFDVRETFGSDSVGFFVGFNVSHANLLRGIFTTMFGNEGSGS